MYIVIITSVCTILNLVVPSGDSKSQDIRESFSKFLRDFIIRNVFSHTFLDRMIGIYVRSW